MISLKSFNEIAEITQEKNSMTHLRNMSTGVFFGGGMMNCCMHQNMSSVSDF